MNDLTEFTKQIQKLVEDASTLNDPTFVAENGREYFSGTMQEVEKHYYPNGIQVSSLQAMVDYITSGMENEATEEEVFIHVVNYKMVVLYKKLDDVKKRTPLMMAELDSGCKSFKFDYFHDIESFVIGMYSMFEQTDDLIKCINKASTINVNSGAQTKDQSGAINTSLKNEIKTDEEATVFNLKPFRTFREFSQPVSSFVFRIDNRVEIALYEADGGAWRIAAIASIKKWLADQLKESSITIIA